MPDLEFFHSLLDKLNDAWLKCGIHHLLILTDYIIETVDDETVNSVIKFTLHLLDSVTEEHMSNIEVEVDAYSIAWLSSKTIPSQRGQGYNTLLRILVMLLSKSLNVTLLVSQAISPISYHLLRKLGFWYAFKSDDVVANLTLEPNLLMFDPGSLEKYRAYLPASEYEYWETEMLAARGLPMRNRFKASLSKRLNEPDVKSRLLQTDNWALYQPDLVRYNGYNFWFPTDQDLEPRILAILYSFFCDEVREDVGAAINEYLSQI